MQVPGFLWVAITAGLSAFLVVLQTGIQADVTDYWGPIAIAGVGALLKVVEQWSQQDAPEIGTRSIQQPRSGLTRFLFG
jgi:hypothetical protein